MRYPRNSPWTVEGCGGLQLTLTEVADRLCADVICGRPLGAAKAPSHLMIRNLRARYFNAALLRYNRFNHQGTNNKPLSLSLSRRDNITPSMNGLLIAADRMTEYVLGIPKREDKEGCIFLASSILEIPTILLNDMCFMVYEPQISFDDDELDESVNLFFLIEDQSVRFAEMFKVTGNSQL